MISFSSFRLSKKITALLVLPFFIFSPLFLNTPSAAAVSDIPSLSTPSLHHNSFEIQTSEVSMTKDVIHLDRKINGLKTRLIFDTNHTDRIYLLEQTSHHETVTLRYVYDDSLLTVTVFVSQSPEGQEPVYSHYYRYASGPNDSLELILDEGWVNGDLRTPARVYDYYYGKVHVRTFDKVGNLLKIESSDGSKKVFIYSQDGRLLTVQVRGSGGEISFLDQVVAGSKRLELPRTSVEKEQLLYIVPTRLKDQISNSAISYGNSGLMGSLSQGEGIRLENITSSFLLWLESAHPLRAGPAGGLL